MSETPRAPSCPASSKTLGGTGRSMMSTAAPTTGFSSLREGLGSTSLQMPLTARATVRRGGFSPHPGPQLEPDRDPHVRDILEAQAQFMTSNEIDRVVAVRNKYPKKKAAPPKADPITGEVDEVIPRRVPGYNLGFEKVFKTTFCTLPVVAHSIFVELHTSHNKQVFSRRFNGLNTVFDLKKWVFEKILVPLDAYDLSYAEPGKAALGNDLLLLTTQESLDMRTLATTRAVHSMYHGEPGVHSVHDHGVTRLYMRLKCRTCGDLLNSLQSCRKFKSFGEIDVQPYTTLKCPGDEPATQRTMLKIGQGREDDSDVFCRGIPGRDPNIEECWYRPDEKKHCLFHTRGFELFEAARTHGGGAEVARIYICNGKEPSKKLGLKEQIPLLKRTGKIHY
mmetsp:Transcript_95949/g.298768  ORF Transcript_95949/g.298768 Transcript_95949/m.298768 type:complete len:393 (+) Transcript_95949:119-1297(+)